MAGKPVTSRRTSFLFITLLMGTSLGLNAQAFSFMDLFKSKIKQFPDDNRTYRPNVDVGMTPYLAKSLHGTKKLSITYDDGPHLTRTPLILDLLAEYKIKATFFVVTASITEATRPLIARMIKEGHGLASHHHDHDDNNGQTQVSYKAKLSKSIRIAEKILAEEGVHQREMYYRFPYGAYGKHSAYHHLNAMKEVSQELYGENCINFAFWDIDSSDWLPVITPQEVAQNILAHMEGGQAYSFKAVRNADGTRGWEKLPYQVKNPPKGGVILMHDVQIKTLEASRLMFEMAKAKGWEFVPLDSVKEFEYGNKECILKPE